MAGRVSLSTLLTSSALTGPVRASLATAQVVEPLIGKIRVSGNFAVIANPLHGATHVSAQYILTVQSINAAIYFTRLESDSDLSPLHGFGLKANGWTIKVHQAPTPEHNPYRPSIPETVLDTLGTEGYDYLKENQEITREQHNLTQAGDTTFPYQLMIKPHVTPHYRLGSISRFYHQDHGLIQARYVQFTQMKAVSAPACPVGLLKKKGALEWQVTNDIARSDPDLVVGLLAPYTLPAEGEYGWVVTDGPNLQPVQNLADTGKTGEAFSWAETGKLSPTATGRVVARRVAKPKADTGAILSGDLHVSLESHSKADVAVVVDQQTAPIVADVAKLQDQVDTLNAVANPGSLDAIRKSIVGLTSKLNLESAARTGADSALNTRIDELDIVTSVMLSNAITTLTTWIETQLTIRDNNIEMVRALAQTALDLASAVTAGMLTALQAQIDSLLAMIAALNIRPKGKFPIVDGSIPPNLVYEDDGSLVYVETF